jgi:hypothetical protein
MYDLTQTHEILSDATILLMDDRSYRIISVPSYDECMDGNYILLEDEDYGDEVGLILSEVDLNDPEVHVYKLVLANPKN